MPLLWHLSPPAETAAAKFPSPSCRRHPPHCGKAFIAGLQTPNLAATPPFLRQDRFSFPCRKHFIMKWGRWPKSSPALSGKALPARPPCHFNMKCEQAENHFPPCPAAACYPLATADRRPQDHRPPLSAGLLPQPVSNKSPRKLNKIKQTISNRYLQPSAICFSLPRSGTVSDNT